MEFRLAEFLSFRPGSACFLIPAFTVDNGENHFSQVVDADGRIDAFRPVQAQSYCGDQTVPLGVRRRLGDLAVFAARLNNGRIIHGSYSEVRGALASVDLAALGAPFFNVDAMAFIGDLKGRDAAVQAASVRLGRKDMAQAWRGLEQHGRLMGLARVARPAPFDDIGPIMDPIAPLSAKDPGSNVLYTSRGIARSVFDFVVLRLLESRQGSRIEKRDLYETLSIDAGLDVGSYPAFSTRLAQLKQTHLVEWPQNQHNASIQITERGVAEARQLSGQRGIKPDQLNYLAATIPWISIDKDSQ